MITITQGKMTELLAALNCIRIMAEVVCDATDDFERPASDPEIWTIPARSGEHIAHFSYQQQQAVMAFDEMLKAVAA